MARKTAFSMWALLFIVLWTTTGALAGSPAGLPFQVDSTPEPAAILEFGDFTANEARFNPSADNPRALIMMFSFTFTNMTGERLEVRYPRLELTINGVFWTELASTDFQIGRLQADASQTIELQSLMLQKKLTEEQLPIWDAILNQEPLDLDITGTILTYPNDEEVTLTVERTLEAVELPGEWERPESPDAEPTAIILEFGDFTANEARFNPSVDNPRALVMMFSLTFTNMTGERLEVRYPRLELTINGVFWTELASTDFQIGRLQPDASQTIELQSLMLHKKLTDEQLPIWDAILNQEPLDLDITGTILTYPNEEEVTLSIERTLEAVELPGAWERP